MSLFSKAIQAVLRAACLVFASWGMPLSVPLLATMAMQPSVRARSDCGEFVVCPVHKPKLEANQLYVQHKVRGCRFKLPSPRSIGVAAEATCSLCAAAVGDDCQIQCTRDTCKLVFHSSCLAISAEQAAALRAGGAFLCGVGDNCEFVAPLHAFLPSGLPLSAPPAPPVLPTPAEIDAAFFSKNNIRRVQRAAPEALAALQAATPADRKKRGFYAIGVRAAGARNGCDDDEYETLAPVKRSAPAVVSAQGGSSKKREHKKHRFVLEIGAAAAAVADVPPPVKRSFNAQWNAAVAGGKLEARRRAQPKNELYDYEM